MAAQAEPWTDAVLASALALVDPAGLGGVWLRARHGPVRDALLEVVEAMSPRTSAHRRIAASPEPDRLLGGLDLAATLSIGRSVIATGILPSANGGVLTVAMAERLSRLASAHIASALDRGRVRIERDGFSAELPARFVLLALDEGIDDESLSPALADRLAFHTWLDGLALSDIGDAPTDAATITKARAILPGVDVPGDLVGALARAALDAGRRSVRTVLHLHGAVRANAALRGVAHAGFDDAVVAVRLVLGCAAVPPQEEARPSTAAPPSDGGPECDQDRDTTDDASKALADRIVAAAAATLPDGLLDARPSRTPGSANATGRGAEEDGSGKRGPVTGVSRRRPRPDTRIDLLATLRAAAPWQRVRGDDARHRGRLAVTVDDFRFVRRREPKGTTAILVVDASGSAAAARLAETKGAVELLLGACYVRRDEVALVAFRGAGAEVLLEPTRSLVRAKRSLAGLPGGGATPLAHGIVAATGLAEGLRRRGRATIVVFLTDGRGNVALDGRHGREAASTDATAAARRFQALGVTGVVIDTGTRPQPAVGQLAAALGADYVVLPRGGADRISAELSARLGR
jgi:magnesium chelatase subunit D